MAFTPFIHPKSHYISHIPTPRGSALKKKQKFKFHIEVLWSKHQRKVREQKEQISRNPWRWWEWWDPSRKSAPDQQEGIDEDGGGRCGDGDGGDPGEAAAAMLTTSIKRN